MLMQHYTEGFFHWSSSKLNSNAQNTLRVKYIKVTMIKVNLVLIASLHKTEDLIILNPQIVISNNQPHDKKMQKLVITFTVLF